MIKEAIEKIVEMAEIETFERADGRDYTSRPFHPVKPAHPAPLGLSTLAGVVDLSKSIGRDHLIHIQGHDKVAVISDLDEGWLERHNFALATAQPCAFPFDRMLDVEQFVINVQLHFEASPAKDAILAFVSHLSANEVRLASDDGLSQTAVIRTEIGRKENATIAPIQHLRPFRTFREIEQPEGEFLLRLHPGRGELPQVALYQAEGAAWRDQAIESINEYLALHLQADGIVILR